MSDSERSPFLSATDRSSNMTTDPSVETTPLLASGDATPRYDGDERPRADDAASIRSRRSDVPSVASVRKGGRRWPSIIAMIVLGIGSIAIIVGGFFVPAAVEEYAKEAAVLEPTNLSLESITATGVRARIQANFRLDGSRVRNEHVRRLGRLTTWVVRALGTEEAKVNVYLPEYGNLLLGSAVVPPIVLNIVDGQTTSIDFITELAPGDAEGIRTIANDWLEGRLGQLRLRGKTDIQLKSGLLPLGTHSISESLVLEAQNLTGIPAYNITKLNFEEVTLGDGRRAMAADVSLAAFNNYPVQLNVPSLGFDILLPNCMPSEPHILVADAVTSPADVRPHANVAVNVRGLVRELPKELTDRCPGTSKSPLDNLLKQYLDGEPATVFVRGAKEAPADTPGWVSDILSSVTLAVPFPGRSFDNLIKNFSLTDVHFTAPDPFAEPNDPAGDPRVSGTIVVTAALPSEMNFETNVTGIRATADVFYKANKLGVLNLSEWQKANSSRVEASEGQEAMLKIQSRVDDAPLRVTDGSVLADLLQKMFLEGKGVTLSVKARVGVRVETVLGLLELQDVPAEGKIPVKPLLDGPNGKLDPKVGGIKILETTYSSIKLEALVNITNPSPYTAYIPFVSIHLFHNHTLLGEATAQGMNVTAGNNTNLRVRATWNPSRGGDNGVEVGRNLISQYISGCNVTVTIRTHKGTFPSRPSLGESLSKINITLDAPRIRLPGPDGDDPDDQSVHFIREATFHLFGSTATFTLVSPLERNTMYIEHINASALYNHTEPIGQIIHDLPFAVTPGLSQTPRLPVDWSMGSIGFEKMRQALGGTLKLDARAVVGVRLGNWRETVWYEGRGIGAHVRP